MSTWFKQKFNLSLNAVTGHHKGSNYINSPKPKTSLLLIFSLTSLFLFQFISSIIYVNSGAYFITTTISSLVYYSHGWLQTTAFFLLATCILISALIMQYKAPARFNLGAVILALIGLAFVLIGSFPTGLPGQSSGFSAAIHRWATVFVVFLFPVANLLVAFTFRAWNYRLLFLYSLATGIFQMLFVLIGGYYLTIQTDQFGLFERILVWNGQIWLSITCLNLLLSENKCFFGRISRKNILIQNFVSYGLYMYGAILWPLSLFFIT